MYTTLKVVSNLIFWIMFIITFDAFVFLYRDSKYRGYLTLKHYADTLKMPLYRKLLGYKIIFAIVVVTLVITL